MKPFFPFLFLFLLSGSLYSQSSQDKQPLSPARDSAHECSRRGIRYAREAMDLREGWLYMQQAYGSKDTLAKMKYLEQFRLAAGCYKASIAFDPTYEIAWNNMGSIYYFSDSLAIALPYFRRAVQLKDNYPEAWFDLGLTYGKLGQNDSAKLALHKCIACDSAYVMAYNQLALLLVKENKSDSALDLLQLAAVHKPDSDIPWNTTSKIYLERSDTARAMAALEKAAEINPGNMPRLHNLALYFKRKGDTAKYNHYTLLLEEEQRKREKSGKPVASPH